MASLRKPAGWFWAVAIVLALWGCMGVFAFYSDVTMNEQAKAALDEYDRNLMASRPNWYIWLYGVAIWSGLFGAIALLLRSRFARPLFLVSLVTVVLQFGYTFATTDLLAVKGFVGAAAFPIVIVVIAVFQIWFAKDAERRGWIG